MKVIKITAKEVPVRVIGDNTVAYEGIQLKAGYHPIPHNRPYVADYPD
jgi:hypothetical protein